MSRLDDSLSRLPDGAAYVATRGPHLRVGQTELGVLEPATQARLRKLLRILAGGRQTTVHYSIQCKLRHQAIGRNTGQIAQERVDLVHPLPGLGRPVQDYVEVAQQHVDLHSPEAEPCASVHDPPP